MCVVCGAVKGGVERQVDGDKGRESPAAVRCECRDVGSSARAMDEWTAPCGGV